MEGESIAPGNRDKTGGDRPVRVPSRDELESHTVGAINKDRPYNADLVIVDMGEGPIVVKDFAPKPW